MWQTDVSDYCKTCDRCQKANQSTGKRSGNMIKIHKPSKAWELVHIDWVTALPPGGDRGYNACIGSFEKLSKTPIFIPCHKDNTAMDTPLLMWNRAISWTAIFTNIISDRDPELI
ncbi:hypothetical protein O181_011388 [Austropuccinia psidii MF-1]|uniref:Integrase zinc-binding domain-containing protein n=1 Tax=Austropuccinia psidii MF-1 TaxID=1389203 RepID=A0A9Q3BV70_9BASI|nr:hypothetical protein [Austropuccinia psidii MF-1]